MLRSDGHDVLLSVFVKPRSSRDRIVPAPPVPSGLPDSGQEVLVVQVTAPPVDGKANTALCRLIAKTLGVPKSAVSVDKGQSARHKTLRICGTDTSAVEAALRP